MKNGFSFTQVVVILLLSNGLMNHVIVIPMMLDVAKRDAWISVLLSGALYLLWIGILYFVYQKTQKEHLLQWIKNRYGSGVYLPIALLLSLYCFLNATVTMEDTITWISLSFAPETPLFTHSIIFAGLCLVNALLGIRSIAMMSSILLPVVVVLGFFVMTTNFQHKDYSFLLPIMENGFSPVSHGMLYAGTGFAEMILFLVLKHHLKTKISYLKIILLGVVMVGLTLGPTIGAIVEFGPMEAAKLRYPAYEEWRLANIGLYIEHLDFLSIFQWFSGAFIRVSLFHYLIAELWMLPHGSKRTWWLIGLFALSTAISTLPLSDILFYRLLSSYFLPALFVIALFLSIVLSLLTALAHRRKHHEES